MSAKNKASLFFKVDARAIIRLGRDSIRDNTTALLELVKNSYDADATEVEIEIFTNVAKPYIRIADNGVGMSEVELEENWLRIGFSGKTQSKRTASKRRKTGEKGIGRLSADRLGSKLELRTKAAQSSPVGLSVNWDNFDVDDRTIESVGVELVRNQAPRTPKNRRSSAGSGTELIIRELRQAWTAENLHNLYLELSTLIAPILSVSNFRIFLSSDAWKKKRSEVQTAFPETAQLELDAVFNGAKLNYSITERTARQKVIRPNEEISWKKLVQHADQPGGEGRSSKPKLGDVRIKLLFFVQRAPTFSESEFSLADIRRFLQLHAGIKIYRDGVMVKPYGDLRDPQGDWLLLAQRRSRDPAGVGRKTYKIAPNQLVGAVLLGRDSNPKIADSTSREGLIKSQEFFDLRALVLGAIGILESYRHRTYKDTKRIQEPTQAAREAVQAANEQVKALRSNLQALKKEIPSSALRPIEKISDRAAVALSALSTAEKSVQALIGHSSLYRGLATIGIASAVFGHETQASIDEFSSALQAGVAQLNRKPPQIRRALTEFEKASKYSDRVAAWGAFALARVQHEKRQKKRRDLKPLLSELLEHLRPVFDASTISLEYDLHEINARIFEMDIEAILLNLLTNAYHACRLEDRPRKVLVSLRAKSHDSIKGLELSVADSGPGIAEEFKDKIWEPLFSTRLDREGRQIGTGLGLTIVKSICDDLNGVTNLKDSSALGGAEFSAWLPLET